MAKIDYEYEVTEEQVRAYLKVPEIDRLRWLEDLCVFTSMVRQAPTTYAFGKSLPTSPTTDSTSSCVQQASPDIPAEAGRRSSDADTADNA